jgi:cytochrome b561
MTFPSERFSPGQRALHWLLAGMIITMLFVGVTMVSTVAPVHEILISVHKPLGIAILVLVVLRIGLRLRRGTPPFPADLPWWQVRVAQASHWVLYALMVVMPLLGWSMLSAGGYPVVLFGPLHLPPIAPHNDTLHALLWTAHASLAYVFFLTILLHFSAAMFHALVRRDSVFASMAPWLPQRHTVAAPQSPTRSHGA